MINPQTIINTYGSDKFHAFCKDESGYFIDASSCFVELSEISSKQKFIGSRDQDASWSEFSEKYQADDKGVMLTQKAAVITDPFYSSETDFELALAVKIPVSIKGEQALLGLVSFIDNDSDAEFLNGIIDVTKDICPKLSALVKANLLYHLDCKPSRVLTDREVQCIHYYTLGYSAKEVAAILSIANRTVEQHIANAKGKLGCRTKTELISKVLTNPGLLS